MSLHHQNFKKKHVFYSETYKMIEFEFAVNIQFIRKMYSIQNFGTFGSQSGNMT